MPTVFLAHISIVLSSNYYCHFHFRQRSASFTYAEHERDRKEKKCAHGVDVESDSLRETAADIKKQLLHERTNYERLMLQVAINVSPSRVEYDSVEYKSIRNSSCRGQFTRLGQFVQ